MRIIELRSENVKRLKAVRIKPDGLVVQITGKNGAGKTCVLDSIWYALGGKGGHCAEPIRKGAKSAEIVLDLGEIKVTRSWTAAGTSLILQSADGAKLATPQAILDKLIGKMTFDPLAFVRMDAKQQVATLRDTLGLDFADLDRKRQVAYDRRTETNRELKRVEAAAKSITPTPGVVEVDAAKLLLDLRAAQHTKRNTDKLDDDVRRTQAELEETAKRYEALEAQLAQYENVRKSITVIDAAPIEAQLRNAESTNAKVRANRERDKYLAEADRLSVTADRLTAELDAIEEERTKRIAAVKIPVAGLTFDDEGVKLDGVPFEQAASSQCLRAAIGMAIAANPKLRICLVRDGSLLDAESLALLESMAEEHDMQIWIERTTNGEPIGVVIEDGMSHTQEQGE